MRKNEKWRPRAGSRRPHLAASRGQQKMGLRVHVQDMVACLGGGVGLGFTYRSGNSLGTIASTHNFHFSNSLDSSSQRKDNSRQNILNRFKRNHQSVNCLRLSLPFPIFFWQSKAAGNICS